MEILTRQCAKLNVFSCSTKTDSVVHKLHSEIMPFIQEENDYARHGIKVLVHVGPCQYVTWLNVILLNGTHERFVDLSRI